MPADKKYLEYPHKSINFPLWGVEIELDVYYHITPGQKATTKEPGFSSQLELIEVVWDKDRILNEMDQRSTDKIEEMIWAAVKDPY